MGLLPTHAISHTKTAVVLQSTRKEHQQYLAQCRGSRAQENNILSGKALLSQKEISKTSKKRPSPVTSLYNKTKPNPPQFFFFFFTLLHPTGVLAVYSAAVPRYTAVVTRVRQQARYVADRVRATTGVSTLPQSRPAQIVAQSHNTKAGQRRELHFVVDVPVVKLNTTAVLSYSSN